MTLKEDGRKRTSKASKGKNRAKEIKCPYCREKVEYTEGDVINVNGRIRYIECDFCGAEINLK